MRVRSFLLMVFVLLALDTRANRAQQDTFVPPPLPELERITPDNADRLQQLAMLGGGTLRDLKWSARANRAQAPIYIWNIEALPDSTDPIAILNGYTDWIMDLEFSADGTLLASASRDGTIRLWGVPNGQVR